MKPINILYLNSCVYEVTKDIGTDQTHSLVKQDNNVIPMIDIYIDRKRDVSYNEIVEMYAVALQQDHAEKVKCSFAYPVMPNEVVNASKFQKGLDVKMDWTIVSGVSIEQRFRDPTKPVMMKGDATVEERTQAIEDALTPTEVEVPILIAFPETERYMFDIRISHCPPTAVTEYDSTKKEVDPNLDDEGLPMAAEAMGLHIGEDVKDMKKE